jgi:hypothetical protein
MPFALSYGVILRQIAKTRREREKRERGNEGGRVCEIERQSGCTVEELEGRAGCEM